MSFKKNKFLLLSILVSLLFISLFLSLRNTKDVNDIKKFPWPDGKMAAVSLTFDDARSSQLNIGIPLLNKYNVKSTFYVLPSKVEKELEKWKKAVADGHEIGNHTLTHPCSGNFAFSRKNALEEYTIEKIEFEMNEANITIERLLNLKPTSFAYPCGQSFVGRGRTLKSYVPVVAEKFITGRGYRDETINDPALCDLAQLMGVEMDNYDFPYIKKYIDKALKRSGWLILAGHKIKPKGKTQTTYTSMLRELCNYVNDPANKIWIAPVNDVAIYIIEQRRKVKNN